MKGFWKKLVSVLSFTAALITIIAFATGTSNFTDLYKIVIDVFPQTEISIGSDYNYKTDSVLENPDQVYEIIEDNPSMDSISKDFDNKISEFNPERSSSKVNFDGKHLTTFDNYKYEVIEYDGKLWMIENLKMDVDDSYCYKFNDNNCMERGRLYTYKAAVYAASQVEGWRLPTKEDYHNLLTSLGIVYEEYVSDPGDTMYWKFVKFYNLQFGHLLRKEHIDEFKSGHIPDFKYFGSKTALYWTSTNNEIGNKLHLTIQGANGAIYFNDYAINSALSVRLVKDL